MSLGSPHRTTGEMITASIWNTDLVDALNAINVSTDGSTWIGPVAAAVTATAAPNATLYAHTFDATLNKAGSGSHPSFSGVVINPPIIAGGSAIVSNAASLVIAGSPTGAVNSFSFLSLGTAQSQFQGPLTLYLDANQGMIFDDRRVTGPVAFSVVSYVGPNSGEFLIQTSTNSRVAIGVNGTKILTLGDGVAVPTMVVDQATADLECITLMSTGDVAHGFTTDTDTAAFGNLRKVSGSNGGLAIAGYTETTSALDLNAGYTTGDTDKTAGAQGAIVMTANKLTGSTAGAMATTENLLVLRNNTGNRFIFDATGQLFFHGAAATTFDEWDDIALARSLDLALKAPGLIESAWDQFVQYNRADLERAGIITEGGFINSNKHMQLLNGVSWQLFQMVKSLTERVAELEAA